MLRVKRKKIRSNDWSVKDVQMILSNPVYAFGVQMEPQAEICNWIRAFNLSAPKEFWQSHSDLKANAYLSFLDWLELNNFVEKVAVCPPIIAVNVWVKTQEKSLKEKRFVDQNILNKIEAVKVFRFPSDNISINTRRNG
jgi:hypothetical protein